MAPVIALCPEDPDDYAAAVRDGGGTVGELEDADALVWLGGGELPAIPDRVRWVQLPAAGVESWIDRLPERPVVTSMTGAFAQPVAEHALALVLAGAHRLGEAARAGRWRPLRDGTRTLEDATVAIVGAGGIGRALIAMLAPLGCRVLAVTRRGRNVPGAERTVAAAELDAVLAEADVVVLAAPATPGAPPIIDAGRLAHMRPDAHLVNVGRGSLVDTDALVAALEAGRLGGAALDVTDPEPLPDGHPLWDEPACLITPHQADTPEMVAPLLAERIRLNVAAFLGDGRFVGRVDPRAGY